MVKIYYLKLQVQAVTQSHLICHAGCYARLFYVNKKRRKCYTETRYNASYKPGDKVKKAYLSAAQLVERYLGVVG